MTWDAIILIILGWVVVHFFSRQRDLKKDARSFALQTANHVTKIEEKAIAYHVASARNESAEKELILLINDLDTRMMILKKKLKLKNDVSFFRAAITLDNFNTHEFNPQSYSSEIINDISYQATQLRDALYRASLG